MPSRQNIGVLLLLLGSLGLAGCAGDSGRKAVVAAPEPGGVTQPKRLAGEEALEQQAEAQAHYATAIIHDLDDEPEKAAEELYQAALLDAGNEGLVLEVTRRLIQLKQNDKAAAVLAKATGGGRGSGILYARLGLVYSLLGQTEQAIAANRTAIEKLPDAIVGYQNLARIYLQNNQQAEGLAVLDQAAKTPGVEAGFLIDLAELYTAFARASATNARAQALSILNRAAALKPSNPLLMQKLADGFSLLNEVDKAVEVYGKLLERFPNLPGLREKLADIYLRQKNYTKAAEQLEAIIRQNPTNPQAYYFLGSIAFEAKKMEAAVEHFRKALLLNPNLEAAYYDLALAQMNLKHPREALATLEKAQAKFPQSFGGEFFTGLAYGGLKDYSNAVNHFVAAEVIARATDTNRLTHFFYFQLGAAYERNQQLEEAELNLKKALQLSPDFSEAMNYLGYMWADRGTNLVAARELIEKALKAEPKNAAYLDSLAWVLFKMHKFREALEWQLKAMAKEEDPDPTLYDHLGDIYAALEEPAKAMEAWRKALAIEPNAVIEKKLQSAGASAVRQR